MAAEACPRMRWTTFGSAPAPSQSDAHVWRRSCTRKVGRPIAPTAAAQPTDRFQLGSLSGPPFGEAKIQVWPGACPPTTCR